MQELAPEWVDDEYEQQSTPEAVFVRRLDKLDMALQAHGWVDLKQFTNSASTNPENSEFFENPSEESK